MKLSQANKNFIAGLLDGNDFINCQIIQRTRYLMPFQIRTEISFSQKISKNLDFLWLQGQLGFGTVQNRLDGMFHYRITEPTDLQLFFEVPYTFF